MTRVSILGFLDGRYIQRLDKGVFSCFLVLALRIIEIPFLVNEQSKSSVYMHNPCLSVKNGFVYQDMCKKHEGKLINFVYLISSHTENDSLHLS